MCSRGRPRGQGRPRGLHLWSLNKVIISNSTFKINFRKIVTTFFQHKFWTSSVSDKTGILRLRQFVVER